MKICVSLIDWSKWVIRSTNGMFILYLIRISHHVCRIFVFLLIYFQIQNLIENK